MCFFFLETGHLFVSAVSFFEQKWRPPKIRTVSLINSGIPFWYH